MNDLNLALIIIDRHLHALEEGHSNTEAVDMTAQFMENKAFDGLDALTLPVSDGGIGTVETPVKKVLFDMVCRINAVRR